MFPQAASGNMSESELHQLTRGQGMWNSHGNPVGYGYQRESPTGVTVKITEKQPPPQRLSKSGTQRVREAAQRTQKNEKKTR
jgi:hypothetical protein